MAKYHFTGIAGIGMSALAQLHAMQGDAVTGSDRLLDNKFNSLPVWENLKELGIKLYSQDASAVTDDLDYIVLSSAIESDNADLVKAKEKGIKILHRSQLLAQQVNSSKTLAVSGTSGKSTVTAMLFEILEHAGKQPSVITGGQILSLMDKGLYGNVKKGKSDCLVIEADESDGSFVNYRPETGIMLNLTKDHKEMDVLEDYFAKFKQNCKNFIVNADEPNLAQFSQNAYTFGIHKGDLKAHGIELFAKHTRFKIENTEFNLPLTGLYNVYNALAAAAAAYRLGVSLNICSEALVAFEGVFRRFNIIDETDGITVVDDFAHNPAKISAALSAAQLIGKRVLAVYQPHGYAPARLQKDELIEEISAALRPQDKIWFADIYYPGGTVERNISSKDLADGIFAKGKQAQYTPLRIDILTEVTREARPGDIIISMGARDPTLNQFAFDIAAALQNGGEGCESGQCPAHNTIPK